MLQWQGRTRLWSRCVDASTGGVGHNAARLGHRSKLCTSCATSWTAASASCSTSTPPALICQETQFSRDVRGQTGGKALRQPRRQSDHSAVVAKGESVRRLGEILATAAVCGEAGARSADSRLRTSYCAKEQPVARTLYPASKSLPADADEQNLWKRGGALRQ